MAFYSLLCTCLWSVDKSEEYVISMMYNFSDHCEKDSGDMHSYSDSPATSARISKNVEGDRHWNRIFSKLILFLRGGGVPYAELL